MTINKETIEDFFNSTVRAEMVIHLGTMCVDERLSSDVSDAFDSDWEEIFVAIGCEAPHDEDAEEISWYLRNEAKMQGFLVRFATPVPCNISEHGYSCSWGYYTSKWLYAETYQEACDKALVWRDGYIKQAKLAAGIDA